MHESYAVHVRGNVFAGILSAGSFLLSLKTFIVVKLQENVYESSVYKQKFLRLKKDVDPSLQFYKPLRQLSDFLFWCILFCLLASVWQVTIGFIKSSALALTCVFFAAFSGGLVFCALWIIKSILSDWMDCLEERQKEEEDNYFSQGNMS